MESYSSRRVLFLVGMHRAGTSALCAAFNACGASFGSGLLEAMERVNEAGFWESADVVALNDHLLAMADTSWYSVTPNHLQTDWTNARFDAGRQAARELLHRGFGSASLEVVKDPRFCITLPFWLDISTKMGLPTSVCVMSRAPAEVCQSLVARDGFPLGYCMRLLRTYLQGILASVPQDALYADYDRLLCDPVGMFREFEKVLPITVSESELIAAVPAEMKHQRGKSEATLGKSPAGENIDIPALDAQIERDYSPERTLADMASLVVYRGRELTRIGEAHTLALNTLADRDAYIALLSTKLEEIGDLHTQALTTISERDSQLKMRDQQLQRIADLHSYALVIVEERDRQLEDLHHKLQDIGDLRTKALLQLEVRDSELVELKRIAVELENSNNQTLGNLRENEEKLQRILRKPIVGFLIRTM